MIGTRKWKSDNAPLMIHRQTQIRRARPETCCSQRHLHEIPLLKRIRNFGRGDLGGNKQLESWRIAHVSRIHAHAHWKQVRATTAHILFTLPGENIFVRWTGEECWWKHITNDGSDEWKSFPKTPRDVVMMNSAKKEFMIPPVALCGGNLEKRKCGAEAET